MPTSRKAESSRKSKVAHQSACCAPLLRVYTQLICPSSDEELTGIFVLLTSDTSITHLDIRGNLISDKSIGTLASLLACAFGLRSVDMRGNPYQHAGLNSWLALYSAHTKLNMCLYTQMAEFRFFALGRRFARNNACHGLDDTLS